MDKVTIMKQEEIVPEKRASFITPVKKVNYVAPTVENTTCFVINMEHQPEKYTATKTVLESVGFSTVLRFLGVNGKELDLSTEMRITEASKKFQEPATIGISLSHRTLWEGIKNSELSHALITEDDLFVDLPEEYVQRYIREALKEVPVDWDVVYFGHFGLVGSPTEVSTLLTTIIRCNPTMKRREYSRISQRLNTPSFPLGNHAYMISKKGATKLLRDTQKLSGHIDLTMAQLYGKGGYSVYALERRMLQQYSIHSSGATTQGSGGSWFKKLAGAFSSQLSLPHEPSICTSLSFSAGTIFGWKAASILTGIVAAFGILTGVVTYKANYALVGCMFLLINVADLFDEWNSNTITIILANTAVCLVCGIIGRSIMRKMAEI